MDPLDQIREILEANTEGMAKEASQNKKGIAYTKKLSVTTKSKAMTAPMTTDKPEEILTAPGTKENDAAQNANSANKAKFPSGHQFGMTNTGTLKQRNEEEDAVENADENAEELAEKKEVDDSDDDADSSDETSDKKGDNKDGDEKKDKKGGKSDFVARMMAARKGKKGGKETAEESVHIDALFSGESLSEDFKTKAKTIFEAAISEREAQLCEQIAEEYETVITEGLNEVRAELTEQLDSYLDYIAEQWMTENQLQVENGLKLEITESFLNGLRGLFLEHDINVPETKADLIDELADKVGELEEQLNSEMNTNVELMQKLEEFRKSETVAELGEDLAATQFEKFVSLCESVNFEDETDFKKKITIIKENYFKGGKPSGGTKVLTESQLVGDDVEEGINSEEAVELSESMNAYMGTLSRLSKNLTEAKVENSAKV